LEAGVARVGKVAVGESGKHFLEVALLFVAANGGEDGAAHAETDRNGGLANATTSGVDQHRFAGLEFPTNHQGVVGSAKHDRDRRRVLHRPVVGNGPQKFGIVDQNGGGQSLGRNHAHHSLSLLVASSKLETENAVLQRQV